MSKAAEKLLERQAAAVADPDRLIDVREVARRLGISPRQVWKLNSAGRIPSAIKLARSVRWRERDIALFIECGADMAVYNSEQREMGR